MILLFNKLQRKFLIPFSLLLSLSLVVGCAGEKPTETEESTPEAEAPAPKDMSGFGDLISGMPRPTEIPALLERSDITLNIDLVNPSDKAQSYKLTDDKAALNLGVYSTDLAYLSTFSQADKAVEYFKVSQELIQQLGVAGAFEMSVLERFESNLSERDSLIGLVEESSGIARDFLNENERYNVSAMVVIGSFIEGLYIATASVENYPDEKFKDQILIDFMLEIGSQQKPLENLLSLLKMVEENAGLQAVQAQLNELLQEFQTLDLENKIKNNDGSFELKAEMLNGISSKVKAIRTDIVS